MKRKRWSKTIGRRPHTVRIFEREPDGPLYVEVNHKQAALGHRDWDEALAYAADLHAKSVKGDDLTPRRVTIAHVLTLYGSHQTPRKRNANTRAQDQRRAELWTRFLGKDKLAAKVTWHEWTTFIDARRSGVLDPRGEIVPEGERRPVRDRVIEADLKWLRGVLLWATKWQDREGRYLLTEEPTRGYAIPHEKNEHRPVATEDRLNALRAAAQGIGYLPELLDLADGTGRRIGSIVGLRFEDLHDGAITWAADSDKTGKLWERVPINARARAAIARIMAARPGIAGPLFPSPKDSTRPMSADLAGKWLRKAERLAKLAPMGWHAFRRKAATEMKGASDRDVMALMGWSDPSSLKRAYQHADPEGMRTALEQRRQLREAR